MLGSVATLALCLFSSFQTVLGAAVRDATVNTRNGDPEAVDAVGRALRLARAKSTTYTMKKTHLSKSWKDEVLFSGGVAALRTDIDVTCKTCYFKGTVSGHLKVGDNVDLEKIIDNVASNVENSTDAALHELKEYIEDVAKDVSSFHLSDIPAFPTLDVDFDLANNAEIPPMEARFEFDGLELYLDLDIEFATENTYTFKLFKSQTPAGFEIPGLKAGAIFTVYLTLIADADIDINSGFHLKLHDGLALDMELFSKKVSSIKLPGATFELLPIKGKGEGSVEAILELETSLGFELSTPHIAGLLKASTGVEASIYADVADILLDVKASSKKHCKLAAHAEYTFAVGGGAGATVDVGPYGWGPAPETYIPIWYTTLPTVCVASKMTTTTKTKTKTTTKILTARQHPETGAAITARAEPKHSDAMVTTTVSTTKSYTAVNCLQAGLTHCPNNLQNTTSTKQILTTVLTIPSGVDASFPPNTHASVTSTVPFGTNHFSVAPTTGVPKSHKP